MENPVGTEGQSHMGAGVLFSVLFVALFAYGAIRLALAGEWGYALFCAAFMTFPFARSWLAWRMARRRSREAVDADAGDSPIE